jgi:hypothetical protein
MTREREIFLRRGAVCCIAVLLPINALFAFLFWGEFRFRLHLLEIRTDPVGRPCPSPLRFELNTFRDDAGPESIARCADAARRRLRELPGGHRARTFSWEDEMGYPGVTTLVQYDQGYVVATVFSGNDSDTVYVRVSPGIFSAEKCFKICTVTDDAPLPLRADALSLGRCPFPFLPPLCLCVFVLIFFSLRSRPGEDPGGSGSHPGSCRAA